MEKKEINIVAQQFYGNRTATSIALDQVDNFLLGILDKDLDVMVSKLNDNGTEDTYYIDKY